MAQSALRRWTTDEFFGWQQTQPDRHELVSGFPLRMMAGASNRHDRVVLNLLIALGTRLRGSGCTTFTADGAVETTPGQIRRPDAGVDCGLRDPDGFKASDPQVVAEVLSPSTRDIDTIEKVAEYKAVPSLRHIILIEPNAPDVLVWSRADDGTWTRARAEGMDAAVEIASLGLSIPLEEIYEEVEFPERPALSLP